MCTEGQRNEQISHTSFDRRALCTIEQISQWTDVSDGLEKAKSYPLRALSHIWRVWTLAISQWSQCSLSIDSNGNWNESLGSIFFSYFLFTSFKISVTVVSHMYFIRHLAFYWEISQATFLFIFFFGNPNEKNILISISSWFFIHPSLPVRILADWLYLDCLIILIPNKMDVSSNKFF